MLLRSLCFATALISAASCATAADYARQPVRSPYAFSWAGAYAGLAAGYDWGNVSNDSVGVETNGGIGGAFVGYNFLSSPNTFWGVEADLFAGNLRGTEGAVSASRPWSGSFDGRIGYFIGDTAFYLRGGLSFAHSEIGGASASNTGWNVGGGVEEHLSGNLFVRAEYRHSDFGKQNTVSAYGNSLVGGVGMKF